jgi:hypothetical protein
MSRSQEALSAIDWQDCRDATLTRGLQAAVGRTLCSMTVRGVSREAAIADYGVVLTGEPHEDLVSYDAAATDAARATRPALAEVFFDRGPGYARLSGGVSYADVDAVGS